MSINSSNVNINAIQRSEIKKIQQALKNIQSNQGYRSKKKGGRLSDSSSSSSQQQQKPQQQQLTKNMEFIKLDSKTQKIAQSRYIMDKIMLQELISDEMNSLISSFRKSRNVDSNMLNQLFSRRNNDQKSKEESKEDLTNFNFIKEGIIDELFLWDSSSQIDNEQINSI